MSPDEIRNDIEQRGWKLFEWAGNPYVRIKIDDRWNATGLTLQRAYEVAINHVALGMPEFGPDYTRQPRPRRPIVSDRQRFWASWWSGRFTSEGCTQPPYRVFVSGTRDRNGSSGLDDESCVLWIEAEDEDAVRTAITPYFPDYEERFVERVGRDWVPGDRWPGITLYVAPIRPDAGAGVMRSLDGLATALEAAGWEECSDGGRRKFCIRTGNNVSWEEWTLSPPDDDYETTKLSCGYGHAMDIPPEIMDSLDLIRRWQGQAAPDAAMVRAIALEVAAIPKIQVAYGGYATAVYAVQPAVERAVLAAALGTEDGDGQ